MEKHTSIFSSLNKLWWIDFKSFFNRLYELTSPQRNVGINLPEHRFGKQTHSIPLENTDALFSICLGWISQPETSWYALFSEIRLEEYLGDQSQPASDLQHLYHEWFIAALQKEQRLLLDKMDELGRTIHATYARLLLIPSTHRNHPSERNEPGGQEPQLPDKVMLTPSTPKEDDVSALRDKTVAYIHQCYFAIKNLRKRFDANTSFSTQFISKCSQALEQQLVSNLKEHPAEIMPPKNRFKAWIDKQQRHFQRFRKHLASQYFGDVFHPERDNEKPLSVRTIRRWDQKLYVLIQVALIRFTLWWQFQSLERWIKKQAVAPEKVAQQMKAWWKLQTYLLNNLLQNAWMDKAYLKIIDAVNHSKKEKELSDYKSKWTFSHYIDRLLSQIIHPPFEWISSRGKRLRWLSQRLLVVYAFIGIIVLSGSVFMAFLPDIIAEPIKNQPKTFYLNSEHLSDLSGKPIGFLSDSSSNLASLQYEQDYNFIRDIKIKVSADFEKKQVLFEKQAEEIKKLHQSSKPDEQTKSLWDWDSKEKAQGNEASQAYEPMKFPDRSNPTLRVRPPDLDLSMNRALTLHDFTLQIGEFQDRLVQWHEQTKHVFFPSKEKELNIPDYHQQRFLSFISHLNPTSFYEALLSQFKKYPYLLDRFSRTHVPPIFTADSSDNLEFGAWINGKIAISYQLAAFDMFTQTFVHEWCHDSIQRADIQYILIEGITEMLAENISSRITGEISTTYLGSAKAAMYLYLRNPQALLHYYIGLVTDSTGKSCDIFEPLYFKESFLNTETSDDVVQALLSLIKMPGDFYFPDFFKLMKHENPLQPIINADTDFTALYYLTDFNHIGFKEGVLSTNEVVSNIQNLIFPKMEQYIQNRKIVDSQTLALLKETLDLLSIYKTSVASYDSLVKQYDALRRLIFELNLLPNQTPPLPSVDKDPEGNQNKPLPLGAEPGGNLQDLHQMKQDFEKSFPDLEEKSKPNPIDDPIGNKKDTGPDSSSIEPGSSQDLSETNRVLSQTFSTSIPKSDTATTAATIPHQNTSSTLSNNASILSHTKTTASSSLDKGTISAQEPTEPSTSSQAAFEKETEQDTLPSSIRDREKEAISVAKEMEKKRFQQMEAEFKKDMDEFKQRIKNNPDWSLEIMTAYRGLVNKWGERFEQEVKPLINSSLDSFRGRFETYKKMRVSADTYRELYKEMKEYYQKQIASTPSQDSKTNKTKAASNKTNSNPTLDGTDALWFDLLFEIQDPMVIEDYYALLLSTLKKDRDHVAEIMEALIRITYNKNDPSAFNHLLEDLQSNLSIPSTTEGAMLLYHLYRSIYLLPATIQDEFTKQLNQEVFQFISNYPDQTLSEIRQAGVFKLTDPANLHIYLDRLIRSPNFMVSTIYDHIDFLEDTYKRLENEPLIFQMIKTMFDQWKQSNTIRQTFANDLYEAEKILIQLDASDSLKATLYQSGLDFIQTIFQNPTIQSQINVTIQEIPELSLEENYILAFFKCHTLFQVESNAKNGSNAHQKNFYSFEKAFQRVFLNEMNLHPNVSSTFLLELSRLLQSPTHQFLLYELCTTKDPFSTPNSLRMGVTDFGLLEWASNLLTIGEQRKTFVENLMPAIITSIPDAPYYLAFPLHLIQNFSESISYSFLLDALRCYPKHVLDSKPEWFSFSLLAILSKAILKSPVGNPSQIHSILNAYVLPPEWSLDLKNQSLASIVDQLILQLIQDLPSMKEIPDSVVDYIQKNASENGEPNRISNWYNHDTKAKKYILKPNLTLDELTLEDQEWLVSQLLSRNVLVYEEMLAKILQWSMVFSDTYLACRDHNIPINVPAYFPKIAAWYYDHLPYFKIRTPYQDMVSTIALENKLTRMDQYADIYNQGFFYRLKSYFKNGAPNLIAMNSEESPTSSPTISTINDDLNAAFEQTSLSFKPFTSLALNYYKTQGLESQSSNIFTYLQQDSKNTYPEFYLLLMESTFWASSYQQLIGDRLGVFVSPKEPAIFQASFYTDGLMIETLKHFIENPETQKHFEHDKDILFYPFMEHPTLFVSLLEDAIVHKNPMHATEFFRFIISQYRNVSSFGIEAKVNQLFTQLFSKDTTYFNTLYYLLPDHPYNLKSFTEEHRRLMVNLHYWLFQALPEKPILKDLLAIYSKTLKEQVNTYLSDKAEPETEPVQYPEEDPSPKSASDKQSVHDSIWKFNNLIQLIGDSQIKDESVDSMFQSVLPYLLSDSIRRMCPFVTYLNHLTPLLKQTGSNSVQPLEPTLGKKRDVPASSLSAYTITTDMKWTMLNFIKDPSISLGSEVTYNQFYELFRIFDESLLKQYYTYLQQVEKKDYPTLSTELAVLSNLLNIESKPTDTLISGLMDQDSQSIQEMHFKGKHHDIQQEFPSLNLNHLKDLIAIYSRKNEIVGYRSYLFERIGQIADPTNTTDRFIQIKTDLSDKIQEILKTITLHFAQQNTITQIKEQSDRLHSITITDENRLETKETLIAIVYQLDHLLSGSIKFKLDDFVGEVDRIFKTTFARFEGQNNFGSQFLQYNIFTLRYVTAEIAALIDQLPNSDRLGLIQVFGETLLRDKGRGNVELQYYAHLLQILTRNPIETSAVNEQIIIPSLYEQLQSKILYLDLQLEWLSEHLGNNLTTYQSYVHTILLLKACLLTYSNCFQNYRGSYIQSDKDKRIVRLIQRNITSMRELMDKKMWLYGFNRIVETPMVCSNLFGVLDDEVYKIVEEYLFNNIIYRRFLEELHPLDQAFILDKAQEYMTYLSNFPINNALQNDWFAKLFKNDRNMVQTATVAVTTPIDSTSGSSFAPGGYFESISKAYYTKNYYLANLKRFFDQTYGVRFYEEPEKKDIRIW